MVQLVLAALCLAASAKANQIVGRASVIDGDTIEIHTERIRIAGVDAPEAGQTCLSVAGKPWRCGQEAAFALADQVGRATVACTVRGRDRFARAIAQCRSEGRDLGEWMIETGRAVRYYDLQGQYRDAERRARYARRGIWAGSFEMPTDWRRRHRSHLNRGGVSR
nr:thermonuclease family protein [Paracoccus versutus]